MTAPARSVIRNSALMAVAALASRVTGLLAKVVIIYVLALGALNSSYTLANTLPNIVFELLIGGVLTSVAIPLLTRAQRSDPDGGEAYTQQLMTLAVVGLAGATVAAVVAAPLLTSLYLSSDFAGDPTLATRLAYLLLPQIFFYGMAALFGAILNSKESFAVPAWAPVLNNLVVIIVAIFLSFTAGGFNEVVGTAPDGSTIYADDPTTSQLLILGLGTTAGIVVQTVVMIPALIRSGFRFRWRFGIDQRMKEAGSLAGWAVLYVVVSQIGYAIFTRIATRTEGGLAQYYWASLLFQTPYGILGVSVLTAIMPRMSRHAAAGEIERVKDDLSLANRLSAVALLPVTAAFIALAGAIGVVTSLYGSKVALEDAIRVGVTCAGLALGLVPLAMTLTQMRVFYAVKDGRTPVIINAIMVVVRIPLLFLATRIDPDRLIVGLAVATAFSYLVGAVVGEIWLRRRFGPMGTRRVLRTIGLMTLASAVGGGAAWSAVRLIWNGYPDGLLEAFLQIIVGGVIGIAFAFTIASLIGVEELDPLVRRVRAMAGRAPAPVAAPAEPSETPGEVQDSGAVAGSLAQTDTDLPEPTTVQRPVQPGYLSGEAVTEGVRRPADTPAAAAAPEQDVQATPSDLSRPVSEADMTSTFSTLDRVPDATSDGADGEDVSVELDETALAAREAAVDLAPGTMVGGRYRLVSLVAVDAVGNRFWRAKDTVLPRDMAVTLLPEGPATNATVTRTLRAGRLHHIGLPQTLDLGTEDGRTYVVGQWVDGMTLTDLLASGPLEPEVASSITSKIADALAEAHRNGLALGALHPSLVRVNFERQVRLSHVVCYPSATADQDIKAVGGLLYLMLTGRYPLPQQGTWPELAQAPTRGGREVPVEEIAAVSPGLAALTESTLHPEGPHGVHSAGTVATLLADAGVSSIGVGLGTGAAVTDPEPGITPFQIAEQRLMRDRRIKLSLAGGMLVALTVLLAIVVGTVLKRVVDSVQDPVITGDQRVDLVTTTMAATSGGAASNTAGPTGVAPPQIAVQITDGEVYDPEGRGSKDYTSYVDRAFDGDAASAWQTFTYKQQFGPGGIKTGVGLLLTLDRDVKPTSVIVATTTPTIKVDIRTSDGNIDAPLSATRSLASSDVGTSPAAIAIPPDAPTSKYLIVFVTALKNTGSAWEGSVSNIVVNTTG